MKNDDANMVGNSSSEAGYTLVDMLAGLAILAVVAALLPGAMRHLQGAALVGTDLSARASVRDALLVVESRLREIIAITATNPDGSIGLAFRGEEDAVMFVAPTPDSRFGTGLVRYRVSFEVDQGRPEHRHLVLERRAFSASGLEDLTGVKLQRLATIDGLPHLLYFGALEDGGARAWHARWPRPDRLPELIAVMDGRPAVGAQATHLIVAPRLGTRARSTRGAID